MKPTELKQRFDELDAARALGDLSPEEQAEWFQLVETQGFSPDGEFDLLVAGLEAAYGGVSTALPAGLIKKLQAEAEHSMPQPAVAEVISFWRHPALGWAAAAGLAVALTVMNPRTETEPSDVDLRGALLARNDVLQWNFSGTAEFAELNGDVVWQDESQTGFMRFSGLPANDPQQSQYQLWIVDPERDSVPVDGGVFNIPAGDGEVLVPVRAALRVSAPVAFVVTVEKPGGVVVSQQEIVAAIAQRG